MSNSVQLCLARRGKSIWASLCFVITMIVNDTAIKLGGVEHAPPTSFLPNNSSVISAGRVISPIISTVMQQMKGKQPSVPFVVLSVQIRKERSHLAAALSRVPEWL